MRKKSVFMVFLMVTSLSLPSEAETGHHGGFDAAFAVAAGVGTDGRSGSFPVLLRLSHERVMVGVEASFVTPFGVGLNALFYVYNGPRFAIHIIDPGIFYSLGEGFEISSPTMPRAFDISAGAGAEVRINDWLAVTLDWRVYLPDPFRVIPAYADYGFRAFLESVKGGQLWLGVSLTLY
jgi:hypothetical protein